MTWPSSPSKLLAPNCCSVSSNCRNIRGLSQSSDLDWWLAGVYNLVMDDIKIHLALNESSCKLRITQMDILSSPAKIGPHESQPFIHTWGGEKAKDTCPSSILRFLWPSGMSSGVAQVYETMSLMRTTKQNPKYNRAELDVTRKWIISHNIPSLGKAAKPIGGLLAIVGHWQVWRRGSRW